MAATCASSASAWENPLENPYLAEPLEVCDQGSFFVGGVPKVTKYAAGPTAGDPQQITIGQAYVQFQVPKTRRQWPIIFVHGGSGSGAQFESQAWRFASNGYPLEECQTCHGPQGPLPYPPNHQNFDLSMCQVCHATDEGQTPAPPPVSHSLVEREQCTDCHALDLQPESHHEGDFFRRGCFGAPPKPKVYPKAINLARGSPNSPVKTLCSSRWAGLVFCY
jgi:hypothetical protein